MIQVAVYDTKPYDRQFLEEASQGTAIHWRFHDFRLNADTALAARNARAICAFVNDRLDRHTLSRLKETGASMIAMRCAGFNNVDLGAARELNLPIVRVPAYSPHAVAEHAAGLLLALNRKIHRAYSRVRELNFSLNGLVGFDLNGKTAGVVGTGKIGRIFAQILRGFDMRVLAYDPFPASDWASGHGIEYAALDTLFQQSDIVSLHVPLTPETRHIVREASLRQMKRGVILINVSRGKLIDTGALIEALKSSHLGGVALDVYEEEEGIFFEDLSGQVLQDDELARLLTFPNVLITAHQAFLTREALQQIARTTVDNLDRFFRGEPFLTGTML